MERIDQMDAGLDSHIIYQEDEWGKRDADIKVRHSADGKDRCNRNDRNDRLNKLERH